MKTWNQSLLKIITKNTIIYKVKGFLYYFNNHFVWRLGEKGNSCNKNGGRG